MAARKIETTISLDGEQAFKSALSSATREMRVMESELRAVSAAYESNGNSAQFFAAKQQNLRNQIAQQREIVQSLERAVKEAGDAYGQNSAQVDAYTIKLNNARARLSRLEQQLAETDREMDELGRDAQRAGRQLEDGIGEGADSARSSLESLYSTLQQDIGSIKTSSFVTAVSSVWNMATGAYNSVAGFVESTAEYRKQLSFLEMNAAANGYDFSKLKEQLVEVAAVTGDSSSAIEGLSNLLASGVDERQMEAAIEGLAGAIISFPETLKFESLADGLQETLATGQATGAFAELLERMGVSLETFNTALGESETAAGDLDIALAYLAAGGMNQVYEQWQKTNGAMADAMKTQAALEVELAEFGGTLEKYITAPVKEKMLEAMEWVNDEVEKWEKEKTTRDTFEGYVEEKAKNNEITREQAEKSLENYDMYRRGANLLDDKNPFNIWLDAGEKMIDGIFGSAEDEAKGFEGQIDALTESLAERNKQTAQAEVTGPDGEQLRVIGTRPNWEEELASIIQAAEAEKKKAEEASEGVGQVVTDIVEGVGSVLIKDAGAEASDEGKKAGEAYGRNFGDQAKDFINNEFEQMPNPLDKVSPGQALIDRMGVGTKWKEQLDAITRDSESVIPKVQQVGVGMGNAMTEGIKESTQDMSSLFPAQVVVDAENAIPALSAAGEEAGTQYITSFGAAMNAEMPEIPNPLDKMDPGQALIDHMGVAEDWAAMLDSVKSAAESTSSSMTEAGTALGANYAQGISASEGDVMQAAESLAQTAESGAASASGAGAFAAGSNIGAQLAAGLLSQVSYVSSASSRLGSAATSGLGGGGGSWSRPAPSGVISTVLNIDGRAFAAATSSYMSSALAIRAAF